MINSNNIHSVNTIPPPRNTKRCWCVGVTLYISIKKDHDQNKVYITITTRDNDNIQVPRHNERCVALSSDDPASRAMGSKYTFRGSSILLLLWPSISIIVCVYMML